MEVEPYDGIGTLIRDEETRALSLSALCGPGREPTPRT